MLLARAALLFAVLPWAGHASTLTTLYNFGGGQSTDGQLPLLGLTMDTQGNLYGVTSSGGVGLGTVFEVSPPATGQTAWTEKVLLAFTEPGANDGAHPMSPLLLAGGSLYGTTNGGGGAGNDNQGTVFQLSPPATPGGAWTETILHVFVGGKKDGAAPAGALVMDTGGALYGVTPQGGLGAGVLYKLSPPTGSVKTWTETILYQFNAKANHAYGPVSGPVIDASGALYLEATSDNALHGGGGGAILRFTPSASGFWTETILAMFPAAGGDGLGPAGGLTMDSTGALYGTAPSGAGAKNGGAVFRAAPPAAGGAWTLSVLAAFTGAGGASAPSGGVVFGPDGSLVGATGGQTKTVDGTVFQLTPASSGRWPSTILWTFDFKAKSDGEYPVGRLAVDANGNLYGVTSAGGANSTGTVFEVSP